MPARSGAALDEKPLLADVTEAISARGKERRVSTTLKAVKPEISTAVAKEWTFTEMAEFTSVFLTGEPQRRPHRQPPHRREAPRR